MKTLEQNKPFPLCFKAAATRPAALGKPSRLVAMTVSRMLLVDLLCDPS